jgi:methylmalonyl-CoA mutase C-terminal domain/subunit
MNTRVIVAKPGLDGHDRGARIIAMALREAGLEVIYLGLRRLPEEIAWAARDEDAAVVGLSILAGGHLGLTRKVLAALDYLGVGDIPVVVGGVIPDEDIPLLLESGAQRVFPSSTPIDKAVAGVQELIGMTATP